MLVGIIIQLGMSWIKRKLRPGAIISLLPAAVVAFTCCSLEFLLRYHLDKPFHPKEQPDYTPVPEPRSSIHSAVRSNHGSNRWTQLSHELFLMIVAIGVVIILVVIRSIYRTIELSNGW